MHRPPHSPGASTEDLIDESRSGSRIAIGALVERHLPGLRAFVRLRIGAELRAMESESDLVQSVCVELLRKLDGFEYRGEAAFRQWLFETALNKIRKHYRHHTAKKRGSGKVVSLDGDAMLQNSYAALCSPSHHAIAREQVERLERAFDRLPEQYREVLTLAKIVGLSQEELAARMDRSVPSVRNLLSRALVKLSGALAGLP